MTLKTREASHSLFLVAVALGSIVLASCGGGNSVVQTNNNLNAPVPSTVPNTVPVTVGPNLAGFPNAMFTSVTVCPPAVYPVGQNPVSGPHQILPCQTIDNILVDTGSVGLRLVESTTVDNLQLPVVTDSNGNTLHECVQFADFSYVWGTLAWATIQMAGETASQAPFVYDASNPENGLANTGIPIQIITSPITITTAVPADCLSASPTGGMPIAANTIQTLGANGILGVGSFLQDCGAACTATPPPNQYYSCPSNSCSATSVIQDLQLWNPVAAFAYDNNGLLLKLPLLQPPGASASGPITGSLIFGNETQSDNALGQANILSMDAYGNFPAVTLTEANPNPNVSGNPAFFVNYLSPQNGSYIDSGSPALYFADAQSLGIPECLDANGNPLRLYCPASTVYNLSAQMYGANKVQGGTTWNIDNAATLLSSGNSVFATLCGDSGFDSVTDYVDLGVPFFIGNKVFVGFAGTTVYDLQGQLVTYPNGYWAF